MAKFTTTFTGIFPIGIGELGNGQPLMVLNSTSDYNTWAATNLNPPTYNPTTTWNPPTHFISIDTQAGGVLHFNPSYIGDAVSNYQYRIKSDTDANYSDWTTCTSFRITIPNDQYSPGGIQVKRIAGSGKAESQLFTSPYTFNFYEYPIIVKNYYFVGKVLHTMVKVKTTDYIRINTNGYPHNFTQVQSGSYYDFTYDFTGFEGQAQSIYFDNNDGFKTPTFGVTVPTDAQVQSQNQVSPQVNDTV